MQSTRASRTQASDTRIVPPGTGGTTKKAEPDTCVVKADTRKPRGLLPALMQLTSQWLRPALYLAGLTQVGHLSELSETQGQGITVKSPSALQGIVGAGFRQGGARSVVMATLPLQLPVNRDDCVGFFETAKATWKGPDGKPGFFYSYEHSDPPTYPDPTFLDVTCTNLNPPLADRGGEMREDVTILTYRDDSKYTDWKIPARNKRLSGQDLPAIIQMPLPMALAYQRTYTPTHSVSMFSWSSGSLQMPLSPGEKPRQRPIVGGFDKTMVHAPSMLVMSRQFWTQDGEAGQLFNLTEATQRLLEAGHVVIQVAHPDTGGYVVVAQPTPELELELERLSEEFEGQIELQWPTPEAERQLRTNYSRPRPEDLPEENEPPRERIGPALSDLAPMALTGIAIVLARQFDGHRTPRPDPATPATGLTVPPTREDAQTAARKTTEKPQPPHRRRVGEAPDTKSAPPERQGDASPLSDSKRPPQDLNLTEHKPTVGELFNQHVGEIHGKPHKEQIALLNTQWKSIADLDLTQGQVVQASVRMRALFGVEKSPGPLGRLLVALDVSFHEVRARLADALRNNPSDTAVRQELNAVDDLKRLASLAQPGTGDYHGSERGWLGPRQQPIQPDRRGMDGKHAPGDTKKSTSVNYLPLDAVQDVVGQMVRLGQAVYQDDDDFIPRPGTTPHLHLGADFLCLKQANGHHIRIFVNGKLRVAELVKAIDYMKALPSGVGNGIRNLLDQIRNKPSDAEQN